MPRSKASADDHDDTTKKRPILTTGPLDDSILLQLTKSLNDVETARIAVSNRYKSLTHVWKDEDGERWGLGIPKENPIAMQVEQLAKELNKVEKQVEKQVRDYVKTHIMWKVFGSQIKGIGDKQFPRLLATIGDPYWHPVFDRTRTLAELQAYCGYSVTDGHAPRLARGERTNWNPEARKRLYLVAEQCTKSGKGGVYDLEIYQVAKEKYKDAVHTQLCYRCGPSGSPALPGSPLSGPHKTARARRLVAKEILKDMWETARDYHEQNMTTHDYEKIRAQRHAQLTDAERAEYEKAYKEAG